MSNLLPCPFCESKDIEISETETIVGIIYTTLCCGCGAQGPMAVSKDEAKNKWSQRASNPIKNKNH
jgi:Lar family restriction alleviation protein